MSNQTNINDVYNAHAEHFVQTFKNDGARIADIARAFDLAGQPEHARAVEIGSGTGRDAVEIIKHVEWFEGFDPADKLVAVAQQQVPDASFKVADAVSYDYPGPLDVVFAFASLLHVSQQDMPVVFRKVADALRPGGIFYIRLRERPEYAEEVQKDEYGERMFYYYNQVLLEDLAGSEFETVYVDRDTDGRRNIHWLGMALRTATNSVF